MISNAQNHVDHPYQSLPVQMLVDPVLQNPLQ